MEINTSPEQLSRYWVPITFLRRIVFVAIPLFVPFGWAQMQLLLFLYPEYIVIYLSLKPHITRDRRRLELFNEVLMLCSIYNLVLFTPFMLNVQYMNTLYSYSYLAIIFLLIFVNIGRVVKNQVHSIRVRRQKKINSRKYTEHIIKKRSIET